MNASPTSSVPQQVSQHWDTAYSAKKFKYGSQPNAWLAAWQHRFPRNGKALALADGYGRNGVYLAECGMQVTSLDISPVGIEQTRALADERGVAIDARVQDLAEWQEQPQAYDVVALIYAHFSCTPERDYNLRQKIHHKAVSALKPGGLLILEAFSPEQLGKSSGGPGMPHYLYSADDMRQDFDALDLWWCEQRDIQLTEGDKHRGLASVVRLIGSKPE